MKKVTFKKQSKVHFGFGMNGQQRFKYPLPYLPDVLDHIGFQCHAGFEWVRFVVRKHVLRFQLNLNSVKRLAALSAGQQRGAKAMR